MPKPESQTTPAKRHNNLAFHNNKWGYKGVEFHANRGRFAAVIWQWPKKVNLGRYDTAVEAAHAYDAAARTLYGEAAYLNFPRGSEKLVRALSDIRDEAVCVEGHDLAIHGYEHERGINCRICNAAAHRRSYQREKETA